MSRLTLQRVLAVLILTSVCALLPAEGAARQVGTARYVYDDNGRLRAVITQAGEAVVYEYDAAGNITAIRRGEADALEIFSFSPREGIPGDLITFFGLGFVGVTEVSFNGVAGRIVEANPSSLVAEVPEGVTTGPVTITKPGRAATTAQPFVLRGISVGPSSTRLLFGESLQFTARVETASDDPSVTWSVAGVAGGETGAGTITQSGLYTAPDRETAVTVRATSNADPTLYGEAQVTVRDPASLNAVFASLSVSRTSITSGTAAAPATSVSYGPATGSGAATTGALSVRYGSAVASTALGGPVSVLRGPAISPGVNNGPVAVRYGLEPVGLSARGASVSAAKGPHVTGVSPAGVARGATVTLTITGANLGGTVGLFFLRESGGLETGISVSGLTVSEDGAGLSATLTVSGSAALGRLVVVVSTAGSDSTTADTGHNTLDIIPQ